MVGKGEGECVDEDMDLVCGSILDFSSEVRF